MLTPLDTAQNGSARQVYRLDDDMIVDVWWIEVDRQIVFHVETICSEVDDYSFSYDLWSDGAIYTHKIHEEAPRIDVSSWNAFLADPEPYLVRAMLT